MAASYKGMTQRFACVLSAAVLALGTVWSATAEANPVLRIIDSSVGTTDVVDNGAGDASPLAGSVITLYSSGGVTPLFQTQFEAGVSQVNAGPPASIFQTLQFNVLSSGAGTMTIAISEQDITVDQLSNAFLSIGGTAAIGGSVSYAAYIDTGNTLFGTGTTLFSGGPSGSGAFSASLSDVVAGLTTPFSVTLEVTVNHAVAGLTTGNARVDILPEPMTTALLGLGLLGLGVMRRRAAR